LGSSEKLKMTDKTTVDLLKSHFDIALETPDGVKKLRELILSLAMQGKLVKQDPKDQPAKELLKEIEEEKKRLIKSGEIRKQESLPSIKPEEIPYEVPNCWSWTRLSDVGAVNPRNTVDDSLIAGFVPMSLICAEYGKSHKFEERKWGEIKKGFTHFQDNDVVLAKITPCFENGKSCVIQNLPNKIGAGTTELHVFRNRYNKIFPEYVLSFFKSPLFFSVGIPKMTGTAGQKRVPTDYFSSTPFPLPPLAEQKRIVAKIDQLMSLCDKLEAERNERNNKRLKIHATAISKLLSAADKTAFGSSWNFITKNFGELYSVQENVEELKKAILQLAVMGKLVPQDPKDQPASELLKEIEEDPSTSLRARKKEKLQPIKPEEIPYELPNNWIWVRLGNIAQVKGGKRVTNGYKLLTTPTPYIYIRVYAGRLNLTES
jgi:type I restriction enzyme S subunit